MVVSIMTGTARAVELRAVSKRFGDFDAVHPLDMTVRAGEFLTLLGPSGCGKTTLLRLIAGLETASGGEIRIGEVNVTDSPPYHRNIGIMFQDYALFPHMTLIDNIAYGHKMRGMDKRTRRALSQNWLDRIGLSTHGSRFPHELSGGQRQRVALARALTVEPAVLLLDEPLGALDANLRRQMQIELKRVHREVGLTFIYVTHDQEEALSLSDRIAVMHGGRVEQVATAVELYDAPATEFVARFVGASNIVTGCRSGEIGEFGLVECPTLGATLKISRPVVDGSLLQFALRPERIRVEPPSSEAFNCVSATITESLFAGSFVRVRAETIGGASLEATPARGSAFIEGLRPGVAVSLAWEPESLTLLTNAQA
jgi:ABC-type Fe3+/spermidine/putrescine transport system ATPase subunit